MLHPSITDTNAVGPQTVGAGSRSNFSISGNETSTTGRRGRSGPAVPPGPIISGRRCRVWGPYTTSTYGARSRMAAPSWLATQPPTPITRSGRSCFQARQRPISEKTFSSAFSRTEQVLTSRMSASSARAVRSRPCDAASRSAVRAESYSFIWQPNVLM